MSDQDVFSQEPAAAPAAAPVAAPVAAPAEPAPVDAFADKLTSIMNADGTPKYTDVAQALDSIPHAQLHISTIETENATLKEQLNAATAAKDLLAKQAGEKPAPATGLTSEQVAAISRQTMEETAQANTEAANVASVNAKFSELYGDKAIEQMATIAQQSGMSVQAVKQLAKSSPGAVLRLAGITSPISAPVPPKTPGVGQGDNFTPPLKPEPPKSIMGGSNTKDLVANWRQAGEIAKLNT